MNACCDVVNRGVAAWNGKLYLATVDARLIILDAASGKVLKDILTIEPGQPYAITGAPRIAKGKVLIGQGGSEFSQRGYLSAYDAETGELDWRWYVVPGDPAKGFENPQMEAAAKTWSGQWWKTGGGGAPWDSIIYDPTTNYVYVGTGSGAPWPSEIRSPGSGDNLYLSSIVALDLDTGKYVWHYQATPGESWDYDNTSQLFTADLTLGGKPRHVVMQAPKNGFFYVLDAKNGELLSATRPRPMCRASTGPRASIARRAGRSRTRKPTTARRARARWSARSTAERTTGSRCRSVRRPAWCTSLPTRAATPMSPRMRTTTPWGRSCPSASPATWNT
ncbi:MAG: PQQ-binding-like beta-propeller repeat protein [Pseudomonadota bacterium]